MKKKEAQKIGEKLLPYLPGFRAKGDLVYSMPIPHVLQALCFENSSTGKEAFYLNAFIMPLFSPSEHVYFNYGQRLRDIDSSGWRSDHPDLIPRLERAVHSKQASIYLEPIKSVAEFIERLFSIDKHKSLYFHEAIGFAYALEGDVKKALVNLKIVEAQADEYYPWQLTLKERSKFFQELLKKDIEKARKQLEEWEKFTLEHLKIS